MEMPEMLKTSRRLMDAGKYDYSVEMLTHAYRSGGMSAYQSIKDLRFRMVEVMRKDPSDELNKKLKSSNLLTARDVFDDFAIFTEWNREARAKFYAPRRKQLMRITNGLQRLADDKTDILCISMPPGTGKSATEIFFMTWLVGKHPELGILMGSHNSSFLRGVYDECLREMKDDGEYLWHEVFPERKIVKTNSLDMRIDVDAARRFSSLQFSSIGSGNAGKVRAQQLLVCDDLIEGIEEALSEERLNKKYQLYTVDLKQRKQGDCKELHIATRWSNRDIIGRIKTANENNPRAEFIAVPALDAQGNSNFDYGGSNGFSTSVYMELKASMDDASWRALYMNEPIEREGVVFPIDELRYYDSLPEGEPDAIIAVCDTATGSGDDTVMPIGYVYGNDHYIEAVVCSDAKPEVTDRLCCDALVKNKVKLCQFESNAAGGRTADKVSEMVKKSAEAKGIRPTTITKKWTTANKQTKILVNSSLVKERFLFRNPNTYKKDSMYAQFMRKLTSYTSTGKQKHDDCPDAMAQYVLFADNLIGNTAVVMKRFF